MEELQKIIPIGTIIYGTINLLKVMDLFDCKTIVFSSSLTIYGNSEISPLSLRDKTLPTIWSNKSFN